MSLFQGLKKWLRCSFFPGRRPSLLHIAPLGLGFELKPQLFCKKFILFAILLFSANASFAGSQEEEKPISIDDLLLKISQAEKNVSYSGVQEKVLIHAGKPMRFQWKIAHWSEGKTWLEFINPESVTGSAFLQDGAKRRYRGESHIGEGLMRRGFSSLLQNGLLLKQIKLLQENYEIDVRTNETFLDREVYGLAISPKYEDRPAFAAIVDKETGLLLQSRRMPPATAIDTTSKMTRFVEISFATPDSSQLDFQFPATEQFRHGREKRRANVYTDLSTMMQAYERPFLVPQSVPAGFALQRVRVFEKGRRTFVHFLYNDGLSMISLFQREKGELQHGNRDGRVRKPERKRPFQVVRGEIGKIHYSVMGEIAHGELQSMADNLILINPVQTFSQMTIYGGAALAALMLIFLAYKLYGKSTETSDV